jgi:hypothetical protein
VPGWSCELLSRAGDRDAASSVCATHVRGNEQSKRQAAQQACVRRAASSASGGNELTGDIGHGLGSG